MNQNQPKPNKPKKTYDIPECSICLEKLAQNIVSTKCGHVFHRACIFKNLSFSNDCPQCREKVQKATIITLNFDLELNDEAEEMIQAFYNSLQEDERQNVLTIMNQYESQAKELASIKRHREELQTMNKDQQNKLDLIQQKEKELSQNFQKLTQQKEQLASQKDQLTKKALQEELKRKEIQLEHDIKQLKIEELKKSLSELRNIQLIKEKLDSGGQIEDKMIEDIRKNKSFEEQARKFYEMLRMKKGSCEEIKQENSSLQNKLRSNQNELELLKGDIKFKQIKINELKDKFQRLSESYMNQKELNKQKIQKLQQKIQNGEFKQKGMSNSDNLKTNKIIEISSNMDEENSRFSTLSNDSLNQQLKLKYSTSLSKNDLDSIQNPFNMRQMQDEEKNENSNILINEEIKNNDQQNTTDFSNYLENQNTTQQNSNDSTPALLSSLTIPKESQDNKKRSFGSVFTLDSMKYQKLPKKESNIGKSDQIIIGQDSVSLILSKLPEVQNLPNKPNLNYQTGIQTFFGIQRNKNSLLNKSQLSERISSSSATTSQNKPLTISDFFFKQKQNK